MQIEDNLTKISSVIRNHGIILYPADGIWGIICSANSEAAINKIHEANLKSNTYHEILVSDILMLKSYVCHLHPRVETLLHYHQRPIKLLINNTQKLPAILNTDKVQICFRIVKDKWSRRLIQTFGGALYVHSFLENRGQMPLDFKSISRMPLPDLDFVIEQDIQSQNGISHPILLASYDQEGLITIH